MPDILFVGSLVNKFFLVWELESKSYLINRFPFVKKNSFSIPRLPILSR